MSKGTLFFRMLGWTDEDAYLRDKPARVQAEVAARKLMASVWKSVDPQTHTLVIQLPEGCYRILSKQGDVESTDARP